MKTSLPMLIVRAGTAPVGTAPVGTAPVGGVPVAVEMNGMMMGDVVAGRHIAVPLSDNGEYYIAVFPLLAASNAYYPVMRKLRFENGQLQPLLFEDWPAYAWPNGMVELVVSPGVFPSQPVPAFPCKVDQLILPDGCVATLYVENNALHIAIEERNTLRFGAVLGDANAGRLCLRDNGVLYIIAGVPKLPEEDRPEGYGCAILALDSAYRELVRIQGDAVGVEHNDVHVFTRLPTMLQHDRKQVFRYEDGAFVEQPAQIGFFTHAPIQPSLGRDMILAFCDAVQIGLWEEAFSYLTQGLCEGLDEDIVRAILGEFHGHRMPVSGPEDTIGLTYAKQGGIIPVRVFSFQFAQGGIDNLSEE